MADEGLVISGSGQVVAIVWLNCSQGPAVELSDMIRLDDDDDSLAVMEGRATAT